MLTARDEEYDKLKGFELGTDDYVSKPLSPKELMARIEAVLKRGRRKAEKMLRFGELEIDKRTHAIRLSGKDLPLTPKEFNLLLYMAKNHHIALSREQILKNVWGFDFYGGPRRVDTHIEFLCEHSGGYRETIVTVRCMGYKCAHRSPLSSAMRKSCATSTGRSKKSATIT